ncbi:hypothetical protein B6U82_01145, partial [Candidatus Pacearchaeota archaeon ex4484_31]
MMKRGSKLILILALIFLVINFYLVFSYDRASINIINVHSRPELNGNWTVQFITDGKATLEIKATNGTFFDKDIKFLELKCGRKRVEPVKNNNSLLIENYECDETSYFIVKVLTRGKHTLEFDFGKAKANAYNTVTSITLNSPANQTHFDIDTENQPNFNFTAISNTNTTFSCELFINDTSYGSNSSVQNNTATIIQANSPLSLGEYNWYINCTDSDGTTQSKVRIFYVENIS